MNVILITLDAVRVDALSCYNKKRNTPNTSFLAREGTKFENAITQANSTDSSHCSILTSTYPIKHGVRENGWKLKAKLKTIAELLSENDFNCMAAVSVEHLSNFFGLNKGFNNYFNANKFDKYYHWVSRIPLKLGKLRFYSIITLGRKLGIIKSKHYREAKDTVNIVLKWLEKNYKKKFFSWIHLFDAHEYNNKENYFKQVEKVDIEIGRIIKKLKN